MALVTVSERAKKQPASIFAEATQQEYNANQNIPIIVDSPLEEGVLLKALGDEYTRMILLSLIDEPKSVIDIIREKNIPLSSAYRKIHWLEKARLIRAKGFVITDDGKKYHLYQSKVKTIQISLATNSIKVEITSNNGRKYNFSPTQEQEIPIA
ncbi:MAG: winged helix-turn-helix domain-containing protein [Nitrososphaerales archaeon]